MTTLLLTGKCGANAYNDKLNGDCMCNEGYKGDAYNGCKRTSILLTLYGGCVAIALEFYSSLAPFITLVFLEFPCCPLCFIYYQRGLIILLHMFNDS